MVGREYVPERGDMVWMDFPFGRGREQANRRPALILSPRSYNGKIGLALACPVTSKVKGYPFEVAIEHRKVHGVVLADQIYSLAWRERHLSFIAKADRRVLTETVMGIISLMLEKDGPVA